MDFYHIIIVRSKRFGDTFGGLVKKVDKEKFKNFALLCLNDKLVICDKKFEHLENIGDAKKSMNKAGSISISNHSQNSDIPENFKSYFKQQFSEIKNEIKALEIRLTSK